MYQAVTLIGRVGAEATYAAANRPLTFSMSTWVSIKDENETSGWRTETTWHNIILWGNESIKKAYMTKLKKGALVLVNGRIENNEWESEDGVKHKVVRIKADTIKVLSEPKGTTSASSGFSSEAPSGPKGSPPANYDEDLPF